MRAWFCITGGLLIWAAHFLSIYAAASIFPGSSLARWLTLALTALAFGMLFLLVRETWRPTRLHSSQFSQWLDGLAGLSVGLAVLAIVYQSLPALVV